MIERLRPLHPNIYFFCLILLAIALPFSKPVMSIAQILLLLNWLIEGNLREKMRAFFSNRTALVLSSVWLMHLLGLLYTSDLEYGLKEIRTKIPLLLLPLIISTSPKITAKQVKVLLLFFVAAITVNTLISMAALSGLIKKDINDVRRISLFVSHIRFSLMICLSVFILAYYAVKSKKISGRMFFVVLIVWLISFLFIIESMTGIFVLPACAFIFLTYYVFSKGNVWVKVVYPALVAVCVFFLYLTVRSEYEKVTAPVQQVDLTQLDSLTAKGGTYFHDTENNQLENGNYVGLFICWNELEQEWNCRSRIKFDQHDRQGNEIQFTLIRYLSSKGFRKDAEGVNKLTPNDVALIESGVANCEYADFSSIRSRLHDIIWELNEYKNGRNSSGHSLTQRFLYWSAAVSIISENLLFGVGTGDPPTAFKNEYEKNNSSLEKKFRLRSHNQFLAIAVSFGISGAALFMISLFYPLYKGKKLFDYFYISFFMIVLISFMSEDTLESQAGVTFFALFNSLFLFGKKEF